jgi:hypothetical protein
MVSTIPSRHQWHCSYADEKKGSCAQNRVEGTKRFWHLLRFCLWKILTKRDASICPVWNTARPQAGRFSESQLKPAHPLEAVPNLVKL